ncbi:MAG: glycosyltransferase family 2 protein, partial [Ignavibacteriales bacterium]|nr:glycosyltransferase family 2 protein [Ignavibacteriales bacterium]
MNKPLVSVTVNTYNRPLLISRAINSIINQSYKNIEILVYDAGTNEDTKTIISQLEDDRIIYRKIVNEISPAHTLNQLFWDSKGKYIAWQDDDDESYPDRIEKQVDLIESLGSDVGLVYCWEDYYDDKLGKYLYTRKPTLQGEIFTQLLERPGGTGGGTQLLLNREAVLSVGGIPENVGITSDYLLILNIAKKYKVFCINESLVRTHVNHQYQRLSNLGKSNQKENAQINMWANHILNFYKKDFQENKVSQYYYFRTLAINYSKLKRLNSFKYYFLYILN